MISLWHFGTPVFRDRVPAFVQMERSKKIEAQLDGLFSLFFYEAAASSAACFAEAE